MLTFTVEPNAETEKDGLFLGKEKGCGPGRYSDDRGNSCGLAWFALPDDEASTVGNGSPNIEVFARRLLPGFKNKAGVDVIIDSDELATCLTSWVIDKSSSCSCIM